MRRLLLFLLCLALSPLQAAEETCAVKLERAVFLMESKHQAIRARSLLLDLAESPLTPPRIAAEALWLTARICSLQGSDQAAILVLDKLGRDFRGAQPFAAAAGTLAVELARGGTANDFSPNPADISFSEDLAGLAEASLRLGDVAGSVATLQDLDDVLRFIILELKLAPVTPVKTERPHRHRSAAFYEEARRSLAAARTSLTSAAAPDQILNHLQPALSALRERDLDPADLDKVFRHARDALARALGERNAAAASAALSDFMAAAGPLLEGPSELVLVQAMQSRASSLTQAVALAREGKFSEGLQALRHGGHLVHISGGSGTGLVIEDAEAILPALRFRLLGALLHIESAAGDIEADGEAALALRGIGQAVQQITLLLRESAGHPACLARLDRTLQSLKHARQALTNGETGRAADLLLAELYVTR